MARWDNKDTDHLITTISSIKSKREIKNFLRDLLTEGEIIEFGKRWRAARMLNDKIPYVQIVKETGLSSTTIARISKWLTKGAGGYKSVLKQQKKSLK